MTEVLPNQAKGIIMQNLTKLSIAYNDFSPY